MVQVALAHGSAECDLLPFLLLTGFLPWPLQTKRIRVYPTSWSGARILHHDSPWRGRGVRRSLHSLLGIPGRTHTSAQRQEGQQTQARIHYLWSQDQINSKQTRYFPLKFYLHWAAVLGTFISSINVSDDEDGFLISSDGSDYDSDSDDAFVMDNCASPRPQRRRGYKRAQEKVERRDSAPNLRSMEEIMYDDNLPEVSWKRGYKFCDKAIFWPLT